MLFAEMRFFSPFPEISKIHRAVRAAKKNFSELAGILTQFTGFLI
jgi:hypothetical protein